MRKIARFLLKLFGPLMTIAVFRRFLETIEMFIAALMGRGGGSSWDYVGQTSALASFTAPRAQMHIFDVGSNSGKWISHLAENFTAQKPRYHLFECAPYCFPYLEKVLAKIPNSELTRSAVSDADGEIVLHLPDSSSGLASVHARRDTSVRQHAYTEMMVPTVKLDSYIKEKSIDFVDAIKIDVEGHEFAVLDGARDSFKNRKIGAVMFEFGSANVNSRTFFVDFWEFFEEMGYKMHRVLPSGSTIAITQYDDRLEYFRGASNYVASLK